MKHQIAMIFGNEAVGQTAARMTEQAGERMPIHVITMDKGLEVARSAIADGARVIISRGGMGEYLRTVLDIPVVMVKHSVFDYVSAVNLARGHSDRVAILSFSHAIKMTRKVRDLLGDNVEVIHILFAQQMEDIVRDVARRGYTVIVGGKTVQNVARRYGIRTVPPQADEDAVLEAIEESKQYLRIFYERELRLSMVKSILDGSREGILAIDRDGIITNVNSPALEMFGNPPRDPVGADVSELFDFPDLLETARTGQPVNGDLVSIGGRIMAINVVPIQWSNGMAGAVATFYDSQQVQGLEQNIRKQLTAKGHFAKYRFHDIVGASAVTRAVKEKARRFAATESTILLLGETGTGKELFAQSIHNASQRRANPFIAVNCAALPPSIIESELFGYVKGAFTGARNQGKTGVFEMAHTGTIFLDEISELPYELQSRLLRVLQEKEVVRVGDDRVISVDVRILAASNKDLLSEVEAGRFRKDLYYRLSVLVLRLPGLAARARDIPGLCEFFLQQMAKHSNMPPKTIEEDALDLLCKFDYPGNIRQLANIVERALICSNGPIISREAVLEAVTEERPHRSGPMPVRISGPAMPERDRIAQALRQWEGNKTAAAAALGMGRTTLWRKCQKYNLDAEFPGE